MINNLSFNPLFYLQIVHQLLVNIVYYMIHIIPHIIYWISVFQIGNYADRKMFQDDIAKDIKKIEMANTETIMYYATWITNAILIIITLKYIYYMLKYIVNYINNKTIINKLLEIDVSEPETNNNKYNQSELTFIRNELDTKTTYKDFIKIINVIGEYRKKKYSDDIFKLEDQLFYTFIKNINNKCYTQEQIQLISQNIIEIINN
jgi:hypothetical protein